MASCTYSGYCLPLKKAVLVFFPYCSSRREWEVRSVYSEDGQDSTHNDQSDKCYVVQVIVRQAYKDVVKELTAFYLSQFEITKAIESILYAHILTPLPQEVHVDGKGFVLRGKRQPWVYGKALRLYWGEQDIKSCNEKWSFEFEVADA